MTANKGSTTWLRTWRQHQPGSFLARNGQVVEGWSQKEAAAWMGVSTRTWQAWENDYDAPESAVRRIVEYSQSLDAKLDQMMA